MRQRVVGAVLAVAVVGLGWWASSLADDDARPEDAVDVAGGDQLDDQTSEAGDESVETDDAANGTSEDGSANADDESAVDPDAGDDVAPDPGSSETTERGPPQGRFSDLPTVTLDELPPEAIDTLVLIEDGGPYPYDRDDSTFQNREGILPDRPVGHYREYTVETPGSPDRGARRIVSGADGERYWTDDHYDSFAEVVF